MATPIRTRDGAPATFVDVTKSDSTRLEGFQWLRIGGDGNLCLKGIETGAVACTPFAVLAGEYVPFGAGYVMSTGTTATGILGIA